MTPTQEARWHQILDLAALGLTDKEIAQRLGLKPRTIRAYLQLLYEASGARNRTEAVAVRTWLAAVEQATRPQTGVSP